MMFCTILGTHNVGHITKSQNGPVNGIENRTENGIEKEMTITEAFTILSNSQNK